MSAGRDNRSPKAPKRAHPFAADRLARSRRSGGCPPFSHDRPESLGTVGGGGLDWRDGGPGFWAGQQSECEGEVAVDSHEAGTRKSKAQLFRDAVYQKTEGHCAFCGALLADTGWSIERQALVRRGGISDIEKVIPVCTSCLPRRYELLRQKERRQKWLPISHRLRNAVYDKCHGCCAYCGEFLSLTSNWTVDHLIPLSQDGNRDIENYVLCCSSCNSGKGARSLEEYRDHLSTDQAKKLGEIIGLLTRVSTTCPDIQAAIETLAKAKQQLQTARIAFPFEGGAKRSGPLLPRSDKGSEECHSEQ